VATIQDLLTARLARAEERLLLYVTAETQILKGAQSYSIGNRTLTRADLSEIAKMIQKLEAEILQLSRGGAVRVQRTVPRDI